MFREVEQKYRVIHPNSSGATYESILNYSTEKDNPFQRWYRYKEGFSIQFIEKIVEEYGNDHMEILMDPFAGSGTTVLAANRMGIKGIGFEVNPFSFFLMKTKQQFYTNQEIQKFEETYHAIIDELKAGQYEAYDLPELSFSNKVFQDDAEKCMMSCKVKIKRLERDKVFELLFLGWLACIEELSDYRKAGNGLKKRKTVKPIIVTALDVINRLELQYEMMCQDLKTTSISTEIPNDIYNASSLGFSDKVKSGSVDGIIFSPPYANCFDYTEIYKLELWFGDFVKDYDDLKKLRAKSLKSHLNIKYTYEDLISDKSPLLNHQLKKVCESELWDKRIPKMIYGYFEDMFNIIDNCYKALKPGGFCAIVVGNSAYGGEIVPTDLILAEYARSIGFRVDKIEVDRYIITSSQQYEKTKQDGKFLRESVVCLVKEK